MKKLNPDKFAWELYEPSYSILDLDFYSSPFGTEPTYLNWCNEQLVKELKKKAIGYCESSSLTVRPRKEGYAVLCENEDGDRAWFHIDEETFKKICE